MENGTQFDAENETANNNVENTKEVIYDFLQRELIALRMPKVDSNFSGFTEWEKEQVRSPVLLSGRRPTACKNITRRERLRCF